MRLSLVARVLTPALLATVVGCGAPQGSTSTVASSASPTAYGGRALGHYATDELGFLESAIAVRTNKERLARGLPALKTVSYLVAAAQEHSIDQARQHVMSHELNGKSVSDRVSDLHYSWQAVGENVAAGQPDVQTVMTDWMNSSGHRANILGTQYDSLGVGVQRGSDGVLYYTQVFAKPFNDVYQ